MKIACPDACYLPPGYPKLPERPFKPSPYVNVVKKRKDEEFPEYLTQKIKNAIKGLELRYGKDYVDCVYPKKQAKPRNEDPKPATTVSSDDSTKTTDGTNEKVSTEIVENDVSAEMPSQTFF